MKMKVEVMKTKVEVVETTMVTPSEDTPRQGLWLSNLDLAVPKMYMPLVYYYPAPKPAAAGKSFFAPDRVKEALAAALVPFYPLAGRLSKGKDGRTQINCNGEGALFIVARADDVSGEDIFSADDYVPSPEIRQKFVPLAPSCELPSILSMFQVTFLKCGGVVLGTAILHVTLDAVGAFQFMQTWAGLARGLDATEACPLPPSHDRTPLAARSPPKPEFDHPVYSPGFLSGHPRPFSPRLYSISPSLLADIKSRCAPGTSTYCAVTAHLWRSACVARGLAADSDTRLGVAVNARHRLRPPLPPSFFGNAVVRDVVTARVGDFLEQGPPLGFAAETIRSAVERMDDAFVRSLVDHLEVDPEQGGQPGRRQLMRESDLWAVSWLGMPTYDADFGWGKPRLVAPAQTFGIGTAYVMPRASRSDGIAILFELEPQYIQSFEKEFYGN